jgi:transcriptional regulator with XRE-family HTH domain
MTTTIELLDQAKAASGCATDYQFGKRFGIKQGTLSMWRTGNRNFDDSHAALIAEILHREPGEIMALCAAERAKDEGNRSRWLRVAALLAAAVIPPSASAGAHNNGSFSDKNQGAIGIMSTRLRRAIFGNIGYRLA